MRDMKNKSMVIKMLALVAAIIIVVLVVNRLLSKTKAVEEFGTSITIQEIKQISELATASYYGETALKSNKGLFGQKEIVIVGSGKVRAGFDLSNLSESDFQCEGDTLYLNLPEAEILDVIVNPSDKRIFASNGDWSQKEVNDIMADVRNKIEQDAIKHGVLDRANKNGMEKIKQMFVNFGFKEVRISITKKVEDIPSLIDVEQQKF